MDRSNREQHPSFAVAVVNRVTTTGAVMFQSDVVHREFIRLTIHTASRVRDLNHDWVHPEKEVVEIRMSLAQWGSLISSMGIGSGVPVTLVWTQQDGKIEEPAWEPRMAENVTEVKAAIGNMLSHSRENLATLVDAIEQKRGAKAIRDALRMLSISLEYAEGNSEFAIKTLTDAAERVVGQARSDIEASILAALAATGAQSIEAPEILGTQERKELE